MPRENCELPTAEPFMEKIFLAFEIFFGEFLKENLLETFEEQIL